LTPTATQSSQLMLVNISKNLQLSSPLKAWELFINNINSAFSDIRKQFQEFIISEMAEASSERLELIRVVNSELNSPVYTYRIMKMSYKLYNEFLEVFVPKEYFGIEQKLAKYFQKIEEPEVDSNDMKINNNREAILRLYILEQFQTLFNNTNSAKYPSADKIFEIFAKNLFEEFPNYCYICWERVICQLKEELRSEFPCLNDILKMVKKYETALPVMEVEFLKELKLID
jgi:hypothetical protein